MTKQILEEKCDHCGIKVPINHTYTWEMQHLHFADNKEIQYLTCENCKQLNPTEYLKKIEGN